MKKLVQSVIILTLAFTMLACSNKQNEEAKKTTDLTEKESPRVASDKDMPFINTSREDCISGCHVMWKATAGNAGKSENDMTKDCNSLCDASQGIQNKDVASCEKAEGVLRDTCFSDVAKKTNDPELCKKITGKMFIDTCYVAIVENTKDKTLCENVTNKYMKEVCLEK